MLPLVAFLAQSSIQSNGSKVLFAEFLERNGPYLQSEAYKLTTPPNCPDFWSGSPGLILKKLDRKIPRNEASFLL